MLSALGATVRRGLTSPAALGCLVSRSKHTLPELPYEYNAMEPIISTEIMRLHHSKHHAAYVNNLNAAEEQVTAALANGDISRVIQLQPALNFNGGGHLNHTIFWDILSPSGGGTPKGDLLEVIIRDFGSFDKLKNELTIRAVNVQGSGWAWVGYNKGTGRLRMAQTSNQDPLEATVGLIPVFGIDVWEHAYYLQYKNMRADYVKALFNIVNWENVAKRYQAAIMAC